LKDQFIIVDVESETVVIDVSAASDKFDEFLPKAQKVLDSVEWKGA
jgi:acetolactate synthase small subunit